MNRKEYKWTETEDKILKKLIEDKLTKRLISQKMGYSPSQILKKVKELNLSPYRTPFKKKEIWTQKLEEEILKLKKGGNSIEDISKLLKIEYHWVFDFLRKKEIILNEKEDFWTEPRKERLKGLFERKMPIYDIAIKFKKEKQYIIDQLNEMGMLNLKRNIVEENIKLKESGSKKCFLCKEIKTINENFYIKNGGSPSSACKTCSLLLSKKRNEEFHKGNLKLYLSKKASEAKRRAKKYKWNFDIDSEFLLQVFSNQNGLCFYTKEEMKEVPGYENSVSLDRIDSKKGYTKDNVVLCSYKVNLLKNDLPLDKLFNFCEKILENKDCIIKHLKNL